MHRRLPVTFIGGFLGAGKTSLLHHVITDHQGGHLAVLLESAGALTLDARALRGLCGAMGGSYHAVEEFTSDDDLAEKLRTLAQAARYERVLVEVGGTTDAATWARVLDPSTEDPAGAWAKLDQIVCVVDLLDFHRSFVASPSSVGLADLREFQRGLVEGASLIVLNKCDLLGEAERRSSTRLLREMNREAPIIETDYGEVPPEMVLRAHAEQKPIRARKENLSNPAAALESVIFRAHRPFHPGRFWEWFNAPHAGLLRVKGLVWLATRNLLVGGVSRTVWQNGCGAAGIWWAALPREEWPTAPQALEEMHSTWREPYGDRRQELVLIGESGPTGTAARQLNHCLLTDDEYARPPEEWSQWPDPFPAWDLGNEPAPEP